MVKSIQEESPAEETLVGIPDRLAQNLLKQACAALDNDQLDEAKVLFIRVLDIEGVRVDQKNAVRQNLKTYSDEYTQREPPDWTLAHGLFALGNDLDLQNEDTQVWHRDLWLKQADFLLDQEDIDDGFEIFKDLNADDQPAPMLADTKAKISKVVLDNIAKRADSQNWSYLNKVIGKVKQELSNPDEELYVWLDTIGKVLAAVNQATDQIKGRQSQLTQKLEIANQQTQQLQTDLQHKQNFVNVLIGLIVVTVVVYIGFAWMYLT
ncbi:MAG: hypothetical protein KDI79_30905 [Anaerolineae bacterium]|nr:hypothetical protein [Anaerolineae bacterium]